MEVVSMILVEPFARMAANPAFLVQVVWEGFVSGVLYALIALGFVLIFKASGVFNFAQGIMVVFAALTLVGLHEAGVPAWIAVALSIGVMYVLAVGVERVVLRPLVNQPDIILLMATIGLTRILVGLGELIFGGEPKIMIATELGIPSGVWRIPLFDRSVNIKLIDLTAAIVAIAMVAGLGFFFSKTKVGRALRAVADDHQAALSVGISLNTIWAIVWSAAGIVALVAGIMWGAKSGIQFSLSLIALKALPVLILGGFDSVPGAIVGGLIIGVGEKLAEVYFGPLVGGAVENWFAYMLALVFLLVRPEGLFGEKIIRRV